MADRSHTGANLRSKLPPEVWDMISNHYQGRSDYKNMNDVLKTKTQGQVDFPYTKSNTPSWKRAERGLRHTQRKIRQRTVGGWKVLEKEPGTVVGSAHITEAIKKVGELVMNGKVGTAQEFIRRITLLTRKSDSVFQTWIPKDAKGYGMMSSMFILDQIFLEKIPFDLHRLSKGLDFFFEHFENEEGERSIDLAGILDHLSHIREKIDMTKRETRMKYLIILSLLLRKADKHRLIYETWGFENEDLVAIGRPPNEDW